MALVTGINACMSVSVRPHFTAVNEDAELRQCEHTCPTCYNDAESSLLMPKNVNEAAELSQSLHIGVAKGKGRICKVSGVFT